MEFFKSSFFKIVEVRYEKRREDFRFVAHKGLIPKMIEHVREKRCHITNERRLVYYRELTEATCFILHLKRLVIILDLQYLPLPVKSDILYEIRVQVSIHTTEQVYLVANPGQNRIL